MFMKKAPGRLPAPVAVSINVYDHYFQTPSLKPLGQSKPNLIIWALFIINIIIIIIIIPCYSLISDTLMYPVMPYSHLYLNILYM